MYSPSKKLDKELYLEIGETILAVANIATTQALDLAEEMGLLYSEIETRIATKDYTQDDYYLEKFETLWHFLKNIEKTPAVQNVIHLSL